MRNKEKEILEALVPENKEVHAKKSRRSRRRFGVANYLYSSRMPTPFSVRFPS